MSKHRTPTSSVRWSVVVVAVALALAACGGSAKSSASIATRPGAASGGSGGLTAAELAEARRLVDPDHEPTNPTPSEVACVARVVVLNPPVDEIANDMAQIDNGDLRQLVMTDYLQCAYNFVLDLYMRFAPSGLSPSELGCIRHEFTQLSVSRLSEVMVLDPDAGYTGPLVIHACQTGAKVDPLLHGTLPGMGGGNS